MFVVVIRSHAILKITIYARTFLTYFFFRFSFIFKYTTVVYLYYDSRRQRLCLYDLIKLNERQCFVVQNDWKNTPMKGVSKIVTNSFKIKSIFNISSSVDYHLEFQNCKPSIWVHESFTSSCIFSVKIIYSNPLILCQMSFLLGYFKIPPNKNNCIFLSYRKKRELFVIFNILKGHPMIRVNKRTVLSRNNVPLQQCG